VKLDAEGELRGKDDELTILARQVCDSLTQVGQERRLEALNPYDRRIIHMVVGERPEFETESLGSGHFKNMIIRRIK
jgi:spoIIIJ-associated protein